MSQGSPLRSKKLQQKDLSSPLFLSHRPWHNFMTRIDLNWGQEKCAVFEMEGPAQGAILGVTQGGHRCSNCPCCPLSEEYTPLTSHWRKNIRPWSGSNLRCYTRGRQGVSKGRPAPAGHWVKNIHPGLPLKEEYTPLSGHWRKNMHPCSGSTLRCYTRGELGSTCLLWPLSEEYTPLTGYWRKNMHPCSGSNLRCYTRGSQVINLPLLAIESRIYTPDWPLKEEYAPLLREYLSCCVTQVVS